MRARTHGGYSCTSKFRKPFSHLASSANLIHELFAPVVSVNLTSATPVLIDDLPVYHILFDPISESISGLIDFGTGLGDPACDIAVQQLGNMEKDAAYANQLFHVKGCH